MREWRVGITGNSAARTVIGCLEIREKASCIRTVNLKLHLLRGFLCPLFTRGAATKFRSSAVHMSLWMYIEFSILIVPFNFWLFQIRELTVLIWNWIMHLNSYIRNLTVHNELTAYTAVWKIIFWRVSKFIWINWNSLSQHFYNA